MQRRKSVFNNEMEQRFSLRKYTIGLCSVCLGFVTIGMGSQSVKADTVNNVEKSSVVREDKMQDADSATTKPNITPTETKKNEIGSVATTAPKTNTTSNGVKANTADSATSTEIKPKETKLAKTAGANNSAVVNTPDQSKSEDSSAVTPTSEKTQLQTSQDSSIKAKENSLDNKSNAMKAVAKFINLNEENNSSDPNSKDVEVKPKESSNVDTNEQKKITWNDTFHWVYADKDDPDNPIFHKAEDNLAGKKFADDTVVTITFTPKDGKYSTDGIEVSQTGPKLNLTGITDLGATTSATDNKTNHTFRLSFDYNSVPVPQGYDLAHSEYQQTFTLEEGDGKLSFQTPDRETTVAVYKRNSQTLTIKYVDDDENGRNIFDPDTSTVKEGDTVVTNIQDNLKKLEDYILVPNQNLPEQITVGNKAIDPIIVHLKHKTEQQEVTKDFVQGASFYLSGLLGAGLFTPQNSSTYGITGQELFIKGTQKYDLVTRNFIGDATWDYSHIYQAEGDDDKGSTEAKDLDAINNLGDLDKTYIDEGSIYYAEHPQYNEQYNEQHKEQFDELGKLMDEAHFNGPISTQTWLKDGLHADGYYLSEKTSLVFDGKSWLNLKEYQEKVDPNFTWTTTSSPEVMQGDHAVDHINPEKLTLDLLPKLDSKLNSGVTGIDSGREIFLNYVPYTYKHHSAQRTINIHLPNGEVKTVSQKADAKQPIFTVYTLPDARNDKLASQETGNWTGGEWAEYDAPVVAGYTASQPTVSAKAVTGDTQNETIDITYVASEHTSHVKLVDNDNKTIQDTPVMGKTGETANVSVTVPKGWQLTQGQELPTQISFNAEGHPDVVVQIEHKTIKVTPDNPKENGTVLPDNPSLHFNGVSHDDLNKTVTREVTITDPTGKKSTTTQTVTFTRGATVDEVTNKVTYDDWSENGKHTFDKVDVPTVPGYTASQNEVPATEVTSDMTDQTINISYTANSQTIHVNYVDDEKADKIVHATTVTGKTGETVSLNLTVPDKYQLADGQQLPTTYTFAAYNGDVTIHLTHKVVQREATADVQMGVITLVDLNDEIDPATVVTQTHWTQVDDEIKDAKNPDSDKVFPSVKVGTVTGHVNYDLVDNKVVSFADDWTSLNVGGQTYQMPDGTEVVNGVLTDSTDSYGKSLKEQFLKYYPDADPDYVNRAWHGYLSANKTNEIVASDFLRDYLQTGLAGNESNTLAKAIGDQAVTAVKTVNKTIDSNWLNVNVDTNVDTSEFSERDGQLRINAFALLVGVYVPYVEKTATRTINVTTPDGKTATVKQTATLAKRVDFGKDAHPDWTTSEWTNYDVPVIPGYTASQSNVAKEAVTGTTKDQTVNITYTANDGTQTIVYQDEDGSEIGKQVISGKTDEKVKVTPDVPDGYVVKGEVPNEVTIKPDDTPITITIEHGKSHIDPDKPVNSGEHIPGTTDKTYPSGLTHDDLNKTITREVTIIDPTGKKSTTTQTVTFTRGATVDEVTNKVTYADWSENGKHTFDKVDVPTVPGYTASGEVPSIVVTPETQSSKVDITYTANSQTIHINYVDDENAGKIIHATTVTGKTGETVSLNLTVPDKYQLANSQQLPTTYTFAAGSSDVTIDLTHKVVQREATIDVQIGLATLVTFGDDEDEPGIVVTQNQWTQLDDEIKKSYTTHLEKVDPTVGVVGTLTGHVNYDLVDNKVVSFADDWTSLNLGGQTYQMPNGTDVVNGVVLNSTVVWGKKLKELFLKGYPDTDPDYVNRAWHGYLSVNKSNVNPNFDRYKLVGNESNALAKATDDRAATAIKMSNKSIDLSSLREPVMFGGLSDFNEQDGQLRAKAIVPVGGIYIPYVEKTATRTINVTTPDGKTATVKQTATLAKRVDFDKDAHPDWTTSEWTSYDVPVIPGYTASQSNVAKEAVTGTTKDQTVNITYTANDGTQTIIYQGEDGSEIGKQVISGKTDEKVKVTPDVPDGYVVKGEVPSEVTIKPDDTPITITIEHGKSHIDPDKPVNSGEHIPGTTDKTYPSGLTHDDLNKTITREVTITDPTGKKSTTTQTVTFTRGATVDEVTNKVTYDDWSENGKHTFDKVDVPTVPGYTASGEVPSIVVTPETQSSKVNITYTANDGTQTIVYQDEDGSEIGKQVISGKTDEKVKVTPDVPDGYVLKGEVPSEVTIKPDDTPITVTVEHGKSHVTPDKPVNKGDLIPDTKDKHYPEGLTHNDLNKTVTREITIIDPTGKKSTTTQTVTFTRGATVDEVTNKVTYDDWSENGKHTFDKVEVPTVPGYTASGEVPSIVVTPETQSSKVDITYSANAQTAMITYIDDTEKKTLGSDKQNGKFNQVITFEHDPAEVIKGLEEKGYKLVSNDFNSNKYQADNSNNVFYVHLKHGTSESSRKDDVNMTVHYVMDDGSKAPSDSKQTVSFTESGIKDNVTGNITWMPVASQTLKDVDSPMLTGYTADIKTANGKVVNFGDPDINVTVHYSANAQTATITYIDDTEKKTLGSDKQNGKFNQVITFEHDPAEVIKGLEEKGYKLVSDNFKPGVKYQNDNKSNSFEVHLVHTYEPVETSQTITETVHYIDANGKPVAPDHVATVVVKVTGTRDKVTDSITWNTPSTGHFDEVISPVVPNMTPDKKLIPSHDVQYGDSDITESVVYTPDEIPSEPEKPNDQGKPNSKTPEKPNKPNNSASKTPEKPNKPCNSASKTSEKSNKSSKEVSKQFGTIAKTTIPEKLIDSRTVDNHVSAKSTAKQELPQTGATTNTGIWTGLVSMIAGLGLVGASKKRKKN